jgi:hypothetical protein
MSFGHVPQERPPYLKATFNSGDPEDILAKAKRSQENRKKQRLAPRGLMENAKLELIARVTTPDGRVIERTVLADDSIPSPDGFNVSTKGGFLESFDALEKTILRARNQVAEEIAEAYLDEASKKNG